MLECFASSERSLGLTEIARAVGLTPSTTHRLAPRADRRGLRRTGADDEHYRFGIGIAVLGQRALEHSGYNLARPVLEQLASDTGESASLGIRRGSEVVVIERATQSGGAALRPPDRRRDRHACVGDGQGAAGVLDECDRRRGRRRSGALERFTDATRTGHDDVVAELEQVATLGFATNIEERHVGVCGLAAPVRSRSGVAHAAVGVQGPSVRLTPERGWPNSRPS